MKITLIEPIGLSIDNLIQIKDDFNANNHEFIHYDTKPSSDDEIISRSSDSDIIIVSNLPISEQVIIKCPNLKMISVAFTGVDHIPIKLCNEKNILVSNAAGYSNNAVAELTIGSAISLIRKLNWCDNQTRNGLTRNNFLGTELYSKTIGIIGLGQIGQKVANLALAFGCKVIAYNRTPKNISNIREVDLTTLLKESDIISLHLPLNHETENLIDKKEFELMNSNTILINTARGPIINLSQLKYALENNKIAGAAIDVYEKEPPLDKDHILFDAPNTLLLPHIGYATKEAIELRGNIVIENIIKWMDGKPQNVMN